MLLNQEVARILRSRARWVPGLALLSLATGCQMLGGLMGRSAKDVPDTSPVVAARSAVVESAPESAIDAAIARAGTPGAETTETANVSQVALNSSAPMAYTVKRGDTLWDISAMYLRDPWLWPEIWHVNPSVRNPHLIYPGDQLTLAYGANGEPQLRLVRGDALRVSPLVRSNAIEGPIATIPYDAIASFLGRPSIVSKEDLRNAPQVTALRDRHMVAGAGHEVYVRGLKNEGAGRYSVVRVTDPLKDPETGKVLGYMGVYAAAARVERIDKLSKAMLIESARETQTGDLLFADSLESPSSDIVPHAPPAGLAGQIMAVVDGVNNIGQYQVVAINRGTRHGLETGHVLAIDQAGEVVADTGCRRKRFAWCVGKNIKLPDERAGTLLVFRTYERMSYGLIVSETVPVRVADHVRTP